MRADGASSASASPDPLLEYQEAAQEAGVEMSKAEAREAFYGMPFERWKDAHQTEASPDAQAKFAKSHD